MNEKISFTCVTTRQSRGCTLAPDLLAGLIVGIDLYYEGLLLNLWFQ